MTVRKPVCPPLYATPSWSARRATNINILPSRAESLSVQFDSVSMCLRGITSTCVSAAGRMSRNATNSSSSWTFVDGISPAAILQKRQFGSWLMVSVDGERGARQMRCSEPAARIRQRLVVVQIQPAFDDTVQRPNRNSPQDRHADQHDEQRNADQMPDQPHPECADLPLEMRFVWRADGLRPLDVVDDDRDQHRDAARQPVHGIERVDDARQRAQAALPVDFDCALIRRWRITAVRLFHACVLLEGANGYCCCAGAACLVALFRRAHACARAATSCSGSVAVLLAIAALAQCLFLDARQAFATLEFGEHVDGIQIEVRQH